MFNYKKLIPYITITILFKNTNLNIAINRKLWYYISKVDLIRGGFFMNFEYPLDNDRFFSMAIGSDGTVQRIWRDDEDMWHNKNDEEKIAENNLNSIQDYLKFFKLLYSFLTTSDENKIKTSMDKLNYLGFHYNGNISVNYNDENSMKESLIQLAFLCNMERENTKALAMYKAILDMLEAY